ncbi:MAG: TolB family protein [Cyanobacterium sp. T60_A2020_053]|nr:TolB family protein [Cyanobacterium sp. T60_A2020_053]
MNHRLKIISLTLLIASLIGGCGGNDFGITSTALNSRYSDEKPSISGDGRWLAMVSNRFGRQEILLFDLQQQSFVDLPGLNREGAITDSPSLSRTGRYLAYVSSIQGRPDIFLYDRATRQTKLLTQGYRSWLRNPRISPDGRYVVFETARRGQWDIEVMDLGINIELDQSNGFIPEDVP